MNDNEHDLLFADTVEHLQPPAARHVAILSELDIALRAQRAEAPADGDLVGAETTELVRLAAHEALGGLAPPAPEREALPDTRAVLAGGGIADRAAAVTDVPPWPNREAAAEPETDELAVILREFEARVHGCLDALLVERGQVLERHYEALLAELRRDAAEAGERRERSVRDELAVEYRERDRQLRANYRRLLDAANRMKQQKAALQASRVRFEQKLEAVNALHDKVEEMRRQLRVHLGPEAD